MKKHMPKKVCGRDSMIFGQRVPEWGEMCARKISHEERREGKNDYLTKIT